MLAIETLLRLLESVSFNAKHEFPRPVIVIVLKMSNDMWYDMS